MTRLAQSSAARLVLAAWCALSMGIYVQKIFIVHQIEEAALAKAPRGTLSDLYPRWYGGRELLLHGRNPYSAEVSHEIEVGFYGRALDPHRASDPTDKEAFAYPVYVVFLLAPTVYLNFTQVRIGFELLLVILTLASVLLWLRFVEWQVSRWAAVTVLILALGSFSFWQGLKLQQLSLLVCAMLAGALVALAAERPILAGVLLAFATIKPQLTVFLVLWLILWTTANWRERQRWFWSFAATMVVLVGGGELLLQGWLVEFVAALRAYRRYTGSTSVFAVLLPSALAVAAWAAVAVLLLLASWRARHASLRSREFQLTTGCVLAGTLLLIPMMVPYNYLLLLPGIFWLVRQRDGAISGRAGRLVELAALTAIIWPWLATTGLVLALLFLPREVIRRAWHVPLWSSLMIPVTVSAALALRLLGNRPAQSSGEAKPVPSSG
jgi:hypothetical protein